MKVAIRQAEPAIADYSLNDSHNLEIKISGNWVLGNELPSPESLLDELLLNKDVQHIYFNGEKVKEWDSRLLAYILKIYSCFGHQVIDFQNSSLPQGLKDMLQLATAKPAIAANKSNNDKQGWLFSLGLTLLNVSTASKQATAFLGEATLSLYRLASGQARFRTQDLLIILQESGPGALPIVTLISLLIGLILAFVGAVQLRMFGADIYIANLVALGMVREMGAMMTAIIMAGRTGASYAARIGAMQVNEEIDAFRCMGIRPMDFLVLPRLIALIIMLPLLTLYSDAIGVLGGLLIGVGMLDLSLTEYYTQTVSSITLIDCATGLIKSVIFGVLVALAGCMHGMQCGRSSASVGKAATAAVVSGIVAIVVADSVLTIIYDSLKI